MNEYFSEITASNRLLKAIEVSKILNISRSMTYRLLEQGTIPCIRISQAVRIHPKDLIDFIDASRMALHKSE